MESFKPLPEHNLLHKLVGEWTFEGLCNMGPDQPPMANKGTASIRSLGGLWILASWNVQGDERDPGVESMLTIGFDPEKVRFVGTFVADCMPGLWVYDGQLDPTGRILTLDTEGPSMMPEAAGAVVPYRDIYEFVSDDEHKLRSEMKAGDQWVQILESTFRRVG